MKARSARARGTLQPWLHVAFWFAHLALALAFGGATIVLLDRFARGAPARAEEWGGACGSAIAVALLIAAWRRYWFLRPDLGAVVAASGGTPLHRIRFGRRALRARVRDLWLVARLDSPLGSYWPVRLWRVGDAVRAAQGSAPWGAGPSGGLDPRYMLSASEVSLFRLGDFGALPETELRVAKGAVPETADAGLSRAISEAADALQDAEMELRVEIRARWLRVDVRGGSWLGAAFGPRVRQAIDFAARLADALAPRFTPLDPGRWTVAPRGDAFEVVEIISSS